MNPQNIWMLKNKKDGEMAYGVVWEGKRAGWGCDVTEIKREKNIKNGMNGQ